MKEKTLPLSAIEIAESGNQGFPKMSTTLPNDFDSDKDVVILLRHNGGFGS
ncbi:hypothetical protein [Moorena producens]|uniref:hypothetical protein n=1 Tax=Moorena producens TaxID=1155739 RepID=UPI003C766595